MISDYERVNFWTIEFPEKKTEQKINEVLQEETTSQSTDKSEEDETAKSA